MSDAYIVGIDALPFGHFPDRSVPSLGAESVLLALDDCGLRIQDVQALSCGNVGQAAGMVGQRILREIGQTGIPVVNCANACATGATAFRDAWMAIKTGLYDVVLAVGVEQMDAGLPGSGDTDAGISTEGPLGSRALAAIYAEAAMEHTKKYGTSSEQFAKVAVKNHHHATLNPKAMVRVETPLERVLKSDMIAVPITELMCSFNADGAAAAVLCSETRARELGLMGRAVRIAASVLTSDPWQERGLVMPDLNTCTRQAAAQAYEMAGVGPDDLDLVELHDVFATGELLHYENLGLCRDGDAGRLIDEGEVAFAGRIPVNVSGGLLSRGHPVGASGIANLCEVAAQLRGEAGRRQVDAARLGMTHVIGLGSACAIHILEKTPPSR